MTSARVFRRIGAVAVLAAMFAVVAAPPLLALYRCEGMDAVHGKPCCPRPSAVDDTAAGARFEASPCCVGEHHAVALDLAERPLPATGSPLVLVRVVRFDPPLPAGSVAAVRHDEALADVGPPLDWLELLLV